MVFSYRLIRAACLSETRPRLRSLWTRSGSADRFLPVSAVLNSLPTDCGTPPYPPGVWAAAAMSRDCAWLTLGMMV